MNTTEIINIIGTAAFAVSGYMVGARKRLDILGVVIVSLLTAIGGGMLRDGLISRIPAVFLENIALSVIFITLVLAWLLRLHRQPKATAGMLFITADAIGLVAFSITGAQIALGLELNFFGVLMLGFISAVGGGIVRDVLVNEMPFVLKTDIYGSISILVSTLLYVLHQMGGVNAFSLNFLLASGVFLRLIAYYRRWSLPGFQSKTTRRVDVS